MESILLVIAVFLLFTFFFKKAAGTLNVTKLNMISILYYYILFFNLIGGSLVFLGSREHYLIQKIAGADTITVTYYSLAYCVTVFPLFIFLTHFVCKILYRGYKTTNDFIKETIFYNRNMKPIQALMVFLSTISLLATAYVFFVLGRIPGLDIIRGGDINVLRQAAGRYFSGNQYIKNIFMLMLTPFLSYYAYIYYSISKGKLWKRLFVLLTVLSIIAVTYDFSKAPIINYILGIYLINVILGRIHSTRQLKKLLIISCGIILFFYVVMLGVQIDSIASLYSGPIGRILFTQIAALFLHFDAFPVLHPYLEGASFNSWLSFLIPVASGLRSGRVVMEVYNASAVNAGTAGVMNTLFIGEAYANYGILGVIIAPVIFGIIIGFVSFLLSNLKKRPTTILLYVELSIVYVGIVEGGFIDIFYSAIIIMLVLLTVLLDLVAGNNNTIHQRCIKQIN